MPHFYFLHASTGRSWPTSDPRRWLLAHCDDDLLAAARERLSASPDDTERCIRVALRRCGLVLAHVAGNNNIIVRHWSDPAPDLRSFAKQHGLTQGEVQVVFSDVKHGKLTVYRDGRDKLLYGEKVPATFPPSMYRERLSDRGQHHGEEVAAWSTTNFDWQGVGGERIPWDVLRQINEYERGACPNCDDATLVVVGFAWHRGLLSWRPGHVDRVCFCCDRWFPTAEADPLGWLARAVEPCRRPAGLRLWRRHQIDWTGPTPRLL